MLKAKKMATVFTQAMPKKNYKTHNFTTILNHY